MGTADDLPLLVRRRVQVDQLSGCWIWNGARSTTGYGNIRRGTRNYIAHRFVWALLVGPLTPGLEIDHVCRIRACVNPAHLREVTRRENVFAPGSLCIAKRNGLRTSCVNGHPFTAENTTHLKHQRRCRTCHRESDRRRQSLGSIQP